MSTEPESPPSMVGRLLMSVSWQNATWYRYGGRGREEVLLLEVLQALDLLPRTAFLGNILGTRTHGASQAVQRLAREVERVALTLSPFDLFIDEYIASGIWKRSVQPDALLESTNVYCVLEAKRIKTGSFQYEQLAREFLVARTYAKEVNKTPLLLLVLPAAPPVRVKAKDKGTAMLSLRDAVEQPLRELLSRAVPAYGQFDELVADLDSIIAYTTWNEIDAAVSDALQSFRSEDPSVAAAVGRIVGTLSSAIARAS